MNVSKLLKKYGIGLFRKRPFSERLEYKVNF